MKIFLRKLFLMLGYIGIIILGFYNLVLAADTVNVQKLSVIKAADPVRVQKRLLLRQRMPKVDRSGAIVSQKLVGKVAGLQAKAIRFKINKFIISGVTVYTNKQLAKFWQPYLGRTVSIQNLYDIATAITRKYRNDGYVLTKAIIPPQKILRGVVRIRVIEGYVSKLQVEDVTPGVKRLIYKYMYRVLQQKPLQVKTLERAMLLVNDIPGIEANSIIKPSSNIPGSAKLVLLVKLQKLSASLLYNNFGTRYLGPIQKSAAVYANSILRAGGQTAFSTVLTSPRHELRFFELAHSELFGHRGARVTVGGSYTRTQPGFTLSPSDFEGTSKAIFANFSLPMIRTRIKNLFFLSTLSYFDSKTTLASDPYYHDKLLTLQLGAAYNVVDRWRGYNVLTAYLEQGIKALDAGTGDNLSRADGKADFTKFNIYVSRLQKLFPHLALLLAVNGQYTGSALYASEELGFGGRIFGRGYDPSEIIGDRGVLGKAELQFTFFPELRFLQRTQYYVFYDAGKVWNYGDAQPSNQSAASAGFGVRFNFTQHIVGELLLAKPLTRNVKSEVEAGHDGKRWRGFFEVGVKF